MTSKNDSCRELAQTIQALFSAGFEADTATLHFINSTLDHPDHQALQAVLNDVDNCDREGLIDLILSPDLTVYLKIEALLSHMALCQADVTRISSLLPDEMPTCIRIEGITKPVRFVVPFACRQRFLSQLNLTRPIDADIRIAIERLLPREKDRLTALAKIRHSRRIMSRAWAVFLLQFIPFFDRIDKDKWFIDLDFILDLSCRYNRENDIFNAFLQEKQHCLKQVETSLKLTEQLAKNNLETLMMQGSRIGLSADVSKLFQKITALDDLCRLVLGKVPLIEGAQFSGPEAVSFLFEKEDSR